VSTATKKRILFVDDEPSILGGLRVRLRRQQERWDMVFALSGEEALKLLGEARFDVIVTDMRMPGMDGAALLKRVQQERPDVVRIVLSGHSEMEATLRAIPVAHQFLAKPCDANVLENVVERACNLRQLVGDEVLRGVVSKIDRLPPMPRTYSRLRTLLLDEKVDARQVAAVIREDAGVSAKLLQIVNSAFFRLSRSISRIEEATAYLGLDTLQKIVLAAELFSARCPQVVPGFSVDELQQHALTTASIASALVPEGRLQEDAFVAAVLHDLGKLVLAMHLPDRLERALAESRRSKEPLHVVEARLSGVTHAEIGAYLLGIWGLPYFIVEAVANHHAPSRVPQSELGTLAAVHVADCLAHTLAGHVREPDPGWLAQVGAAGRWSEWLERFGGDVARWTAAPAS